MESKLGPGAAILIVDDVPANLMALEAVLEPLGQRIVAAQSGQDALKALLDEEFAVILLDVTMPGLDGLETAQLIHDRSQTRSVPIIFLTAAQADDRFVARAYERGAVDYLTKPFDPDIVRAKVAVFVELYLMRERVKRWAALEASQTEVEGARARLFEILMQLPLAVAVTQGRDHIVELANTGFIKLAGGRALTGRPLFAAFADWVDGAAELDAVLESGQPRTQSERKVSVDGETRFVNYSLQPFRAHDGGVRGLILCGSDVTTEVVARETERRAQAERARLFAELEQALRARDDFLMVASHELRTPLTSLQLTASSLLSQLAKSGDHGPLVQLIDDRMRTVKRQLDRLEQLINGLLDVSRIGGGRLELQLERVDLVEVVREVVVRLQDEAARQQIALTIDASAPVCGRWDRSRADQIVTNLVSNAVKYGHGRPVELRVTSDGERAELRVRDHGIGIAAAQQERIFGKFERAASQRNYGGLGLGLWITRELVELMHGSVRVESTPGDGATFVVTLPLAPP